MDLIEIEEINGRFVTTSLNVAHVFGKEHRNVLRDIENLECSQKFRRLNFEPSSYVNKQGKIQPLYEMTRNGFVILVMGYSGKKAMQFKEAYIARFDQTEKELHEKRLEVDKPKIEFAENIACSKDTMPVGDFANILSNREGFNTGQNRLFKSLEDKQGLKLLINAQKPYQYAIDNGWLEVREYLYADSEGIERIGRQVVVTGKGQIYIEKKLRALSKADKLKQLDS